METQQQNWSEILDKLEKVTNLQNRAGTQAEAEAAAAAMTRLLVKYNLTQEDVSARLGERPEKTDFIRSAVMTGNQAMWRRILLNGIAIHNFCHFSYVSGTKWGNLIGEPKNVEIVTKLFDMLSSTVERLTDEGWKQYNGGRSDFYLAKSWKPSFRDGCVSGIIDAMREAKKTAVESTEGGSALVLVKEEELAEAVRNMIPGLRASRVRQSRTNYGAFQQGYAAGKSVDVAAPRQRVGAGR